NRCTRSSTTVFGLLPRKFNATQLRTLRLIAMSATLGFFPRPGRAGGGPAILTIHFVCRRDIGAIRTIPKKRSLAVCSHNVISEGDAAAVVALVLCEMQQR